MAQKKKALVLGANGGIGGEVAASLHKRGWQIIALTRRTEGPLNPAYEWVRGDSMNREDVVVAATGASLIVHAVNPPGYKNWKQVIIPMLENTIYAAKKENARILMPGGFYNYGAGTAQPIREDTAQIPTSYKGEIRVEVEGKLAAAAKNGAKVLIVRAGDFFGGNAGSSYFSQLLVTPNKPVRAVMSPGKRGVGHAWAYVPDLAETMVRLVESEERLGAFETFNFEGFWDADGTQLIESIKRVTNQPRLKVRHLPWMGVRALSPFVRLMREMSEIGYLWRGSFKFDNRRLVAFLGTEPRTPIDEAMLAALTQIKCL